MGLSGENSCIKYTVFIFNFIFFLIGLGLLGTGIYLKVGKTDYIDVAEELTSLSEYVTAGNLMIAVGVIIVVVAFLGCCGAIKESRCMLLSFFFLLLLIFVLELAAGIFGVVKKDDIEEQLQKDFTDAIKIKYSSNDTSGVVNKAIDNFQKKFECCGYNNWLDWKGSKYYQDKNLVPESCCNTNVGCPTDASNPNTSVYYKKGCFNEVTDWFRKNAVAAGACGVAFAIIQILGLIFSMVLYRAIGSS